MIYSENVGNSIYEINKTINFMTIGLSELIVETSEHRIENNKLKIKNNLLELDGRKSASVELFEFYPSDFTVMEFTVEGVRASPNLSYNLSLSDVYGVGTTSNNYIALYDDFFSLKRNGIMDVNAKKTTYNISADQNKKRNLTIRIDKNRNVIEYLENDQVLIVEKLESSNLIFPIDKMHFKFKVTHLSATGITTEISQIKVSLKG